MPVPAAPMLQRLDLALRVIEALDAAESEQRLSDLARQVGTNKATVYRMLSTFEARGYVVQNPTSAHYSIGPRLRHFGQRPICRNLPVLARPFLAELRDRSKENVHLAVLDGAAAIYIAKEEGGHPVQVVSTVGDRCPAHAVATGKALLAWTDPAAQDDLVAAGLVRYTPLTHADSDTFQQEMAAIRTQGYAVNLGEWRTAVRGVAAPILDGPNHAVAAIGVCGPAERMGAARIAELVPIVVAIASQLSAHLEQQPGQMADTFGGSG